jgi:hypothetical protein
MIAALPLVGKVLIDLAASGVGAVTGSKDVDAKKVGAAADSGDFTQTVDNLAQAAGGAAATQGAHIAARG